MHQGIEGAIVDGMRPSQYNPLCKMTSRSWGNISKFELENIIQPRMKPEIEVSSVKPSSMQYIAKKASILLASILSAQGSLHYLSVRFIRKDIDVVIVLLLTDKAVMKSVLSPK